MKKLKNGKHGRHFQLSRKVVTTGMEKTDQTELDGSGQDGFRL